MITVKNFIFNPFQENTYLLFDETAECIIIDPGCYEEDERLELEHFIAKNNLKPVGIVNTHSHVDHILGNSWFKAKYNVPVYASKKDAHILATSVEHGRLYGIVLSEPPVIDIDIDSTSTIKFGDSELKIIDIPGHTPGCIGLYNEQQKFVFSGDILFKGSIGRTDLPGGDYDQIIDSIKTQLCKLGNDYVVFAGHGGPSEIGIEMVTNPFLTH